MNLFSEKNLHTLFNAGIIIKAFDSIGEITLGLSFYFLSTPIINRIIIALFGDELTEQPRDAVWSFLLHNWSGISGNTQYVWAFIFLAHGITKIFLVIGLVKNKLWVFPIAAVAFGVFALYQTYEIIYFMPSLFLEILTVLDVLFIALIIHEYRYRKSRLAAVH